MREDNHSLKLLTFNFLFYTECMPGSRNSAVIMFLYIYVLESLKHGNLYVGYTSDINKRLKEHNRGIVFSTKPYLPWRIIHFEGYRNEKDARRREKYLKTRQGGRLLKRMLKEYFYNKKFGK
jgi:putative endonuclease